VDEIEHGTNIFEVRGVALTNESPAFRRMSMVRESLVEK